MAPSAGIEPAAYRLGGGRSIRLSYEGEVSQFTALKPPDLATISAL